VLSWVLRRLGAASSRRIDAFGYIELTRRAV